MALTLLPEEFRQMSAQLVNRRNFLQRSGMASLAAVAAPILAATLAPVTARAEQESSAEKAQEAEQGKDTVTEIATAALIAEDLATTFYYNGLVGAVIQDPNLAGPGGSADNVSSSGNLGNVNYIQAALTEEISHANLLRSLLGISMASSDPVQTFYFPSGSFDTIGPFLGLLDALENAFIGAYLNAIQEFATMAAVARERRHNHEWYDTRYSPEELDYLAKVSASIMGIECEHRVLGRVISNSNPANNRNFETNDGINAVYNGPNSAVVALTPFLTSSTGPGFSLRTALANQASVSLPVSGTPPAF
ncbi:MAG: ferritin-like domain-containing protein [Terracidiphilus sp.]